MLQTKREGSFPKGEKSAVIQVRCNRRDFHTDSNAKKRFCEKPMGTLTGNTVINHIDCILVRNMVTTHCVFVRCAWSLLHGAHYAPCSLRLRGQRHLQHNAIALSLASTAHPLLRALRSRFHNSFGDAVRNACARSFSF